MSQPACPPDDQLLALLAGRLDEEALHGLRHHLRECADCCAALAAFDSDPGSADQQARSRGGSRDQSLPPLASSLVALEVPATFDEFRVLRPLGRGAMGQVYLGHDTLLDRRVAIKFVAARQPDAALRERFLIEARAIARLQHPNVVAVHRVGEVAGQPYLVSEFVHGQSLDQLPLPVPEELVQRIGLGLLRGLGAAHRRGVLHRDLKPANAILARDGQVKLLDFGLAKVLELWGSVADSLLSREVAGAAGPELTGAGVVLGTPLYLAPELWRGEPATRRSDLYALGALLYQLRSGQPPHREATIELLRKAALERDARPLAEVAQGVAAGLAQVVDRCLRRDPAERPASCEELCRALEGLAPERATALDGGNPYRGLLPFEAAHRALFFGRAAEVSEILDRLRGGPLVLVSGSSGAGKSSLCRAGVVPRVEEGALGDGRAWRSVMLVPGRRPLAALGDALAATLETGVELVMPLLQQPSAELGRALRRKLGTERGLLVFIDQMEELLTQSDAVEAVLAGEVLGSLAERIPGVRVLMTVRGDFLSRLLEATGLADELAQGLYVLRSLSEDGLREAIEGPARARGVAFESTELVATLVASTLQAEGGLPLLQFALAQLWEGRDKAEKKIPALALETLGGVAGALARHADGVVGRLGAAQSRAARRMLLRLVTLEGTRARRPQHELLTGDAAEPAALEVLVRGRLLVAREAEGGVSYEVAHEALVAGWGTLRTWLMADLDGRAMRERLETAAAEWERLGHGREVLWGPVQLREAEVLAPDPAELLPRAVKFLDASRREASRRQRTRRGMLVALLCLPLLLLLFGQQWRMTRRERQRGEEIALERLGARAENLARLPRQEMPALVAGIQAVAPSLQRHQVPSVPAMLGLGAALTAGRRVLPMGHDVWYTALSPDGQRVVAAGKNGVLRLLDARSGRQLLAMKGPDTRVVAASFSSDGMRILTASEDGTTRLWDARTGRSLAVMTGHTGGFDYDAAAFSPRGDRVITASKDHTARLWDGRDGRLLATLKGHTGPVAYPSFSPDGDLVATISDDHTVRLWDGRDGQVRASLTGADGEVRDLGFSPDGQRLVTAGDGVIRIWSTKDARLLMTLRRPATGLGHAVDTVRVVRYSPDGRFIVSGHQDGAGRVWDANTGAVIAQLLGHSACVNSVCFSSDGKFASTGGCDNTQRLWDLETGQQLDLLVNDERMDSACSFSSDGRRVLVGRWVWSRRPGLQDLTLEGHRGPVTYAVFSPDGERAATAGWDRTARLWDLRTERQLLLLGGHDKWVQSVEFSSDGVYLLTGSGDHTARVHDLRTGKTRAVLRGSEGTTVGVFSKDAALVATLNDNQAHLRIWDWRREAMLLDVKGPPEQFNSMPVFSPDGGSIAAAGRDGVARSWDVHTGQLASSIKAESGFANLAYSPDGKRILTSGRSPQIFDAHTGQRLFSLQGLDGNKVEVGFSPDGRRVATYGDDIRIWDSDTGQVLAIMRLPGKANNLSFSPDSQRVIASILSQGVAQVFPTTTEAIFRKACNLLRYQPEFAQVRGECQGQLDPEPPLN